MKNLIVKLNKSIADCSSFFDETREITSAKKDRFAYLHPKPNPNKKAQERTELRGTGEIIQLDREKIVPLKRGISVQEGLERLGKSEDVSRVIEEVMPQPLAEDTYWDDCWHLHGDAKACMDIDDAWSNYNNGTGMVVAVLETTVTNGFRYTHEDLGGSGNQANDWTDIKTGQHSCFLVFNDANGDPIDPYGTGHGTYTSGCVVAQYNNGKGIAGVAPGCRVMAARKTSFSQSIILATDQGADVISISYTGSGGVLAPTTAIDYAVAAGVPVIWTHHSNTNTESYAGYYKLILVNALASDGTHYYSYGNVDVSAPGKTVYCTYPASDSAYGQTSGESLATPFVASIAALLLKQNPTWGVNDVRQALRQGAVKNTDDATYPMGSDVWTKYYGWGMVNAKNSLDLTTEDLELPPPEKFAVSDIGRGRVNLTWNNIKRSGNWDQVKIRKKVDSAPTSATDGTAVYAGELESYEDTVPHSGDYYYEAFTEG